MPLRVNRRRARRLPRSPRRASDAEGGAGVAVAISESDEYPGAGTSVAATLRLAVSYHAAAVELLAPGRRSDPLAQAPGRLLAIHAIELYLNVWLRQAGETGRQIRSRQHDLAGRARAALAGGLGLRRRTASHLARATELREYLVVRYDPDGIGAVSQVNRLLATLEEVARKVKAPPARPAVAPKPLPFPSGELAAGLPFPPPWHAPAAAQPGALGRG